MTKRHLDESNRFNLFTIIYIKKLLMRYDCSFLKSLCEYQKFMNTSVKYVRVCTRGREYVRQEKWELQ